MTAKADPETIALIQRRLAWHQAAAEELENLLDVLGALPAPPPDPVGVEVELDETADPANPDQGDGDDDERRPRRVPTPSANGENKGAVLAPVGAVDAAKIDPRILKSCQRIAATLKAGPVPSARQLAEKMGITGNVNDKLTGFPQWFAKGSAGWHLTTQGVKVLLAHGG